MQSQRINVVRNAIKIHTREEKKNGIKGEKTFLNKRKSILEKSNVLTEA